MIDVHCHIDLYEDPKGLLEMCDREGVTVIGMTNLPSHFEMGHLHVRPYKRIRLGLGMHPLYSEQHEQEFDSFLNNLHKTSYIGEIGLDYSREGYNTKEMQLNSFKRILEAIQGQPKILSLHSRRAEKDVFELLMKYDIRLAIFHWYSGSIALIDDIVSAGYLFSINPAMILSTAGKNIISRIPQSHILTETDGPFISHGGRIIVPSDVSIVEQYLADLWKVEQSEVSVIISSNFRRLIHGIM